MLHHTHTPILVVLSVLIAIFASYTALDLANSVAVSRGRARTAWLAGGSLAMGVGIWSMHFVGMLAFRLPGIAIFYDVPLLVLSILVAIGASALALAIVGRPEVTTTAYVLGSLMMGAAIAGMHYIGIASMRMAAVVTWSWPLVAASIVIAVGASFVALWLAFRFRDDMSRRGFAYRAVGGVVMGIAISGMHYTAMAGMHFWPGKEAPPDQAHVLATSGLAAFVIGTTLLILGIALTGSIVDRALARRTATAEQVTRILESITDGFFSIDRQWRFTYVNRVAQEVILPLTRGDNTLIGRRLEDAIPPIVGTPFEAAYRRAMQTGTPEHIEAWFPPLEAWIEVHAHPSTDGLSVYFRDVTRRRHDEDALREAIRARDEFLSVASHELRTPLTSLKLQSDLRLRLLAKGDPALLSPERLRHTFETDARQIAALSRLVDDMLDVTRLDTGKLSIAREHVDLRALVTEVVDRYREQLVEVGSPPSVRVERDVVGHWDRFRVEQVLANLLSNAARYGAGAPIEISVDQAGDSAVLAVRDHGRGIANVDQERIFRRFERATSSNEKGGLGLGLYIVRQIVEMHGGTIRVESAPGEGATFVVELPLHAVPPPAS